MLRVSLAAVPNQNFEFETAASRFVLTLNQLTPTLLTVTCTLFDNSSGESEDLISAFPISAQKPLIPYGYMNEDKGNFYFVTPNNEIPHYSRFGTNHRLYYLNNDELLAIQREQGRFT